MTARLGSEYRYFGKLVLVPFRYFSIDTYRNIDIFDNTTTNKQLIIIIYKKQCQTHNALTKLLHLHISSSKK